jgi:hypothetical protein
MESLYIKGISWPVSRVGLGTWAARQGSDCLHWPDPTVPIEATAEAMGKLLQEGKIRGGRSAQQGSEVPVAAEQLAPVSDVMDWHIDSDTQEEIERILRATVQDPVGPEFMAPSEIPAERSTRGKVAQ